MGRRIIPYIPTNTPTIEVIIKLAKVFNVSVDYLIGKGNFLHWIRICSAGLKILKNWTMTPKTIYSSRLTISFKTKKAFDK
ncbi:helix-turn-helix domain-containing protein [Macellibacteroides fermentans]|uniref:HTH cro/C1-type domain-containing protein n=1 Tax=Parabacteroides chartae TaxID=1037355 RepID=A0A1T5D696_9BACT|nr:helix-turn-helix transcriptional regulator [Parabacteroides chartae]SKB67199.1 hypothetical protein SAMN05660349_02288 [Parabacteroides chartae]